ncbi:MAG TPA: DUF1080 domain-containing protein [Methylomirabilota bacterium]|nr:DUF1080 domain-containing protein [Methylomirabilota bacterium]
MKARVGLWLVTLFVTLLSASGADGRFALVGRWDLTVTDGSLQYPSWLQIERSGSSTLVGGYVGRFGSVRPVSKVEVDQNGTSFQFTVPPQWEKRTTDITVKGKLERGPSVMVNAAGPTSAAGRVASAGDPGAGDIIRGETTNDEGKRVTFEGRRAPALVREKAPQWGKKIKLFNGRDLTGWQPRTANAPHGWVVKDGLLVNEKPSIDLVSEQKFNDFKLRAVFRYPKGSNSGIYLRGRYEAQIEDNYGRAPGSHYIGGIYGFLTPRINAAKQAGEWQTMDITLVGRELTLVLNGEPIIERQTIPGITGGALDSHEGEPGPIMLQGDHGVVEFKELTITPAK